MSETERPSYRLLTGADDAAFCHRVSEELGKGYILYGNPCCTFNSDTGRMMVAQAIILRDVQPG